MKNQSILLYLFIFIFCSSTISLQAQYENEILQRELQYQEHFQLNFCGTNHLSDNINSKAEDISIDNRVQQLRSSGAGTWNLTDGYGSSCTQNCTIANATSCSANSDYYMVPLVYTVSNTSCSTSAPSTTELTEMVDIMNDFLACQGVDMQYFLYGGNPSAPNGFRIGDFGCNYGNSSLANIPNVINAYVFSDTGNGTGCNGFAPLPFSTGSSIAFAMSHNCYNGFVYTAGSMNCANVGSLGSGQVLIHELGHFFGLYHTHATDYPFNGTTTIECDDPNTTADDCTMGDLIQDTDEDPDYSGGEIGCTGCNTGGSSGNCAFNNNTSTECMPYGTPNTLNNIMSYNTFQGCINNYTACQKAKMMDALLCVRGPQFCGRDVNVEFAGGAADANQVICLGEPIPSFTATSACYVWYDDLGSSANILATGATFTPNASQVDNSAIGTYTFYLGDVNEINPDCRTAISLEVLSDPGAASIDNGTSTALTTCPQTVMLETNITALPENSVVGWWFTQDSPISSTVIDQNSFDNNTPTVSTTFGIGNIIEATTGTPPNELSLSIDCTSLDNNKTYYATPVVAQSRAAIPDSNCTVNQNSQGSITFNGFPGKFQSIAPSSICVPTPVCDPPTYNYCVTVSGYTGSASNLSLIIRDNNFNGNNLVVDFFIGTGNGNSTYCYTDMDMAGYDPGNPSLSTGMTVVVWEQGGSGMQNASITSSLDITYPGKPAIPFPSLTSYNNCLFGTPISFTCSCGGSSNCPPSYTISGNENGTGNGSGGQNTDGDYETDGSIISTQTITSGTVDYDSGTDITLNSGFTVVLGAVFTAFIDGCGGAAITTDNDTSALSTENKNNEVATEKVDGSKE